MFVLRNFVARMKEPCKIFFTLAEGDNKLERDIHCAIFYLGWNVYHLL